jgi:hypothetical protein
MPLPFTRLLLFQLLLCCWMSAFVGLTSAPVWAKGKDTPTTRPNRRKPAPYVPPAPARPLLRLFQALQTHNLAQLEAQFAFKARQLLRKRIGLKKAFKAYKAAYKRDLDGVSWKRLRFRFTPEEGPVSLKSHKSKEGRVTVLLDGNVRLHMRVLKEKGRWKISSL